MKADSGTKKQSSISFLLFVPPDRLYLSVHVSDDSDDGSEQDAALAEIPKRRFVDDVLFGEYEVEENQHMTQQERCHGSDIVRPFHNAQLIMHNS